MSVDLYKHLPPEINELQEAIQIVEAENPEFDLIGRRTDRVDTNIFPLLADELGIRTLESWLNLDSNRALSLDQRRIEILAKLNERLPYTWIKLHKMLASVVGWDNFELERIGARIVCKVNDPKYVGTVNQLFERIIPMNLYWVMVSRPVEHMKHTIPIYQGQVLTTKVITKPLYLDRINTNEFVSVASVVTTQVLTH